MTCTTPNITSQIAALYFLIKPIAVVTRRIIVSSLIFAQIVIFASGPVFVNVMTV
jgi:hypothetical protein